MMDRGMAKLIALISTLVFAIMAFVFAANQMYIALVVLAVVWIVFFLIMSRFLRCRKCGRMPGRDGLFAQYCPYCGEPLE